MSQTITVAGRRAVIADGLPSKGWSWHKKGYLIYTSRRNGAIKRGAYAHRLAWELAAGTLIPDTFQVHHQTLNKSINDGPNLIACHGSMNPSTAIQCPYTGKFMSRSEFERRFGIAA